MIAKKKRRPIAGPADHILRKKKITAQDLYEAARIITASTRATLPTRTVEQAIITLKKETVRVSRILAKLDRAASHMATVADGMLQAAEVLHKRKAESES